MVIMHNYYLISSPLQLLCAIEAIKHFDLIKNKLIIVNMGNHQNAKQILNLYQNYIDLFDNILLLEYDASIIGWLCKFGKLKKEFKNKKVNKIFIGDLRDGLSCHFVRKINSNEILLLDDGFASILPMNEISVAKNYITKLNKLAKKVLTFYEYKPLYDFKFKHFTFFDKKLIPNGYYHRFQNIKNNSKNKIYNQNEIIFLGAPLVEEGLITKQDYLTEIYKFNKKYSSSTIIYIPHRRESLENVKYIINKFGFTLLIINEPIELYYLREANEPYMIASFFSTALYTLSKLLVKTKIHVIIIDSNSILDRKNHIKKVYDILLSINK